MKRFGEIVLAESWHDNLLAKVSSQTHAGQDIKLTFYHIPIFFIPFKFYLDIVYPNYLVWLVCMRHRGTASQSRQLKFFTNRTFKMADGIFDSV